MVSSLFAFPPREGKESDYVYFLDADDPFRALLYDGQTVKINLKSSPFFDALEVKIKKIGKDAAKRVLFYPDEWRENNFHAEDLGGKTLNIFVLPLSDDYKEESNSYIKRLDLAAKERIFLTLEGRAAEISVRVLKKKAGILRLTVNGGKFPAIFLDDKAAPADWKSGVSLSEGYHHVRVECEGFRSESRRVWIEKGEETTLSVSLVSVEPSLVFKAAEPWIVVLDGRKTEGKNREITVSEGEHSVEFRLDSYKIQRKFYAKKGKRYSITLETSVMIGEE